MDVGEGWSVGCRKQSLVFCLQVTHSAKERERRLGALCPEKKRPDVAIAQGLTKRFENRDVLGVIIVIVCVSIIAISHKYIFCYVKCKCCFVIANWVSSSLWSV